MAVLFVQSWSNNLSHLFDLKLIYLFFKFCNIFFFVISQYYVLSFCNECCHLWLAFFFLGNLSMILWIVLEKFLHFQDFARFFIYDVRPWIGWPSCGIARSDGS